MQSHEVHHILDYPFESLHDHDDEIYWNLIIAHDHEDLLIAQMKNLCLFQMMLTIISLLILHV